MCSELRSSEEKKGKEREREGRIGWITYIEIRVFKGCMRVLKC